MGGIERVRKYWENRPCGMDANPFPEGSLDSFEYASRVRYEREPFIDRYARFEQWKDRDVLEVGVGAGSDAERFAAAGARLVGIDLTDRAVELARKRLELRNLRGRIERVQAEALPFADGSFDLVYSWGVIHHAADPAAAAREMVRVCREGGLVCCMVYNRRSLLALQGRIIYGLGRGRPLRSIDEIAAEHFESPGTRLFLERELRDLFRELTAVRVEREVTPYDVRIGRRLFAPAVIRRLIPRSLGYFMVLEGRKAAGPGSRR